MAVPRVFISYAGVDKELADEFDTMVRMHGVDTFIDTQIAPAQSVVLTISDELDRADFYVLLWSNAAVHREWVRREWAAALALEVRRKRVFLYVVRLDDTELPAMLAPCRYLDAFDDRSQGGARWKGAVGQLVEAWQKDQGFGVPVLPAPNLPEVEALWDGESICVFIRNRALSVGHKMLVPAPVSGQELFEQVRTQLALPEDATMFGGKLGLRFAYQLFVPSGERVKTDTSTPVRLGDGDELELHVTMEPFGPDGRTGQPIDFWSESPNGRASSGPEPSLPIEVVRELAMSAFNHLAPHGQDDD
jgi:FAD/FMN-containing dehydrogenase